MARTVRITISGQGRLVRSVLALIALCLLLAGNSRTATADSTGFRSPATQAADTGGDGDGYERNPADALALDGRIAEDRDSGTNTTLSCTNTGKDRHRFYNYGFTIPAGSTINGIEVRLDGELDGATGYICAQLSWDGGATWTTHKQTANVGPSPATYTLGSPTDSWGRAWTTADFANSAFRLRLVSVANDPAARFSLDSAGVQVYFTPAPADTTGPATSGVAAAPGGGGVVALTATISDAASGNSAIAAAEYFIDTLGGNGTGSVMQPADGAFDAVTEGLTASVDMSAQSAGDHTLYVRGRDAAGNWGAAAFVVVTVTTGGGSSVQATITLVAGTLSVDSYPVIFPGVTLNGLDQSVETSPSPWRAIDSRGTASGWNVTLTSSDFTSGAGTIPVGNFRVRLVPAAISTISGGTPPVSLVSSYQALSDSLPLKLLSAAPGTGMGSYNFVPDFNLLLPASVPQGDYQASIVVSVNSGP